MSQSRSQATQPILIIIIASLGYFVDIYDLILFNVVKKESFLALGFLPGNLKETEIFLFNCQMAGMLAGGLLWGILGDKKGRVRVLFGSILLYSLANIANAYVWDVNSYAAVRFIAGIGLAGELGAGITLITEVMHREKRGYGTMIVVTFGALGAVFAATIGKYFDWKTCYWIGGIMGLLLLLMRVGILESGMFTAVREQHARRGNFFMLFSDTRRMKKYLHCIAMGLPVWFVIGVLINLSESYFATDVFQLSEHITTGNAVMYAYIGLSAGDLLSGILSQAFRSRLRIVLFNLLFCALVVAFFFFTAYGASAAWFYACCFLLGVGTGYWALFVTISAEQFGTNIRATVASTVPNFVRGAVIPITFTFKELARVPAVGTLWSAVIVGTVCIGLAILSTFSLKETFGKDLDYTEE